MTNQDIQKKIKLLEEIIEDLEREREDKKRWIEREKTEKKEGYEDKIAISLWTKRIEKIDLEIEELEKVITDYKNYLLNEINA